MALVTFVQTLETDVNARNNDPKRSSELPAPKRSPTHSHDIFTEFHARNTS
jgi:hypothetical protein